MSQELASKLANEEWLRENEEKLRNLFPDDWTNSFDINYTKIDLTFKKLGIKYNTQELMNIFIYFERIRIVLVKGNQYKRNPNSIFN